MSFLYCFLRVPLSKEELLFYGRESSLVVKLNLVVHTCTLWAHMHEAFSIASILMHIGLLFTFNMLLWTKNVCYHENKEGNGKYHTSQLSWHPKEYLCIWRQINEMIYAREDLLSLRILWHYMRHPWQIIAHKITFKKKI